MKKITTKICLVFGFLAIPSVTVYAQTGARPESLTLQTATDRLIDKSLAVEAARLELTGAEQTRALARLRPRPTVTVAAENLRVAGDTPFSQLYEASAVFNQPFELGGRRKARTAVADSTVSLAEARLTAVIRSRIFDMHRLFYEALLAQERIRSDEENIANFEELVRVSEVRLQEGDVSPGDVMKIKLERIKFQSAVANSRLAFRQAKIKLLEAIGDTEFSGIDTLELREPFDFREFPLSLGPLKDTALDNRPEIAVANASIAKAQSVLTLERSRAKGEIVPYAGYRRIGRDNAVLAGVTIPLPAGDRNQLAIVEAEIEQKLAETSLAQLRNKTSAEVETSFAAFETAREQVKAYRAGVLQQADESLTVTTLSYREGAVDLVVLLDAQRTRTDVRTGYFRALLDYYSSIFQLELLTGTDIRK